MQYWCAIFCAMGFVFLFFFMEETNYDRHAISGVTATQASSPTGSASPAEIANEKAVMPKTGEAEADTESSQGTQQTYKKKNYLDKIKLFQSADLRKSNHLGGMIARPLIFLSFPVIFYAGFSYGSNLVWFNVLNATASLILSGEPYNFQASMVGLSYLSPLIGVAVGSFYTGVVGDKVVLRMARRNKGLLEAEHRLWLFLPSLLLIPFGLILWGVGAAHHIHWFG